MARSSLLTVIETPSFLRDAKKLLNDDEREALVNFLSSSPKAGVIIQGTGGIRKIRWAREDTGKSGAYRVIYFYHSMEIPLFLLQSLCANTITALFLSCQD
jgi:mRNA-degrading endonuclease RelE of RelBE toxin-antitoxin system